MKLDLTIIKNESIAKCEKSLKRLKSYFEEMLFIALAASVHEIDNDKKQQVEITLNDLLNDEINKLIISFTGCMNKATNLIENELGS